ncbi:NXPE family member 3-like [Oreochromis aureus]|uniref:NXPE family member 3-like n=1 Tax=Oreochromis aureus TaxID=47969 RepID=UPI00195375A5|nr:NXPE family member 3-like [Oreochromis aureus]
MRVQNFFVPIWSKKCGSIFLVLAVFVLIFIVYDTNIMETPTLFNFHNKVNNTKIIHPPTISNVTPPVGVWYNFWKLKPLSPKEAFEEDLLLQSIAWPDTPALQSLSLRKSSDPAHSTFNILGRMGGGQWQIGDKLEVIIKMYDFQGHPKNYGGDVIVARLHNPTLGAGVAGKVVDHLNGSYSAVFSLLWEGNAQVEVILVHPSEAVTVLGRLTREQPDRVFFKSQFRSGRVSETTTCNVCLRPSRQPVCNYTELHTGQQWFCYKPKKLSCDARISHSKGGFTQNITVMESKLFQRQPCHWAIVFKAPAEANGVSGLAHSDLREVEAGTDPGPANPP